jgi:hypothetical protein
LRREADVTAEVVTPVDRVRWGSILAGLFTALSSLAVLGVLGVAIAGSAYDPGDSARSFGIGAGIWGIISVLVSFALGGWVAARSAAVRGHNNGLLNGAMVWAVAIPMMAYLLAGGAARVANTAAVAAGDAVQGSARVTGDGVSESARNDDAMRASAEMTPDQRERAADAGARTAWGTLIALLLGLAAAATGGYLGAPETHRRLADSDETLGVARPATA